MRNLIFDTNSVSLDTRPLLTCVGLLSCYVLEATDKVNGVGEISHPYTSQTVVTAHVYR